MIKSIQCVKQVGAFSNFPDGGRYRFNKLTFIFGLNSYGKSTICDIFKSLATNNPSIIQHRRTIPPTTTPQSIRISVEDYDKERPLEFKNNSWENNKIAEYIEVFDTNFIHENVFTGLTIERKNKESLTDFILGAESVKIAEQIASLKKKIADGKKELKNIIPEYVKDKSDEEIISFINLKVEESSDEIKSNLFNLRNKLKNYEENQKNINNIISMKEPIELEVESFEDFRNSITLVNETLYKGYDLFDEVAASRIDEHINCIGYESIQVKDWIKQGLSMVRTENGKYEYCPFCGQNLDSVQDLINAYKNYFNDEYSQFINDINKSMDMCFDRIINTRFDFSMKIIYSINIIKDYKEKIIESKFGENISELEGILIKIVEHEKKLSEAVNEMKAELEHLIATKRIAPFSRIVSSYNTSKLTSIMDVYMQSLNTAKELIAKVINSIHEFKDKYRTGAITEEIKKINNEINVWERKFFRIEQDKKCVDYLSLKTQILKSEKDEEKLSKELETSQTAYLDKYFTKINEIFKELGSSDFTIQRVNPDNRGYKKVYGIRVKYKGKPIEEKDLQYVFSESDRRALALSIFWAKIALKDEVTLSKTIIILDDPVTSFDENRITASKDLIEKGLSKVTQVIILTHYPNLIKRFCEIHNDWPCSFLKIERNADTSFLNKCDNDEFILDEHQKMFFEIYDFINRNADKIKNADIGPMLRVFMEQHLKIIFNKAIKENNLEKCGLENIIDGLKNNNIIDNEVAKTLHEFRKKLNPEHHIYTSRNEEDIRKDASDLLEFMYSVKLNPKLLF